MSTKKLSIVVPVYNEGNTVILAYEEILRVYKNISTQYAIEIIFVNDGSRDDSWNIIDSLAAKDDRIL